MLLKRTTQSIIGKLIVGDVTDFIHDNAKALENDALREKENFSMSLEDSAKQMSHAIAYGIAKALSNDVISKAFATGICPPGGDIPPYQVGNTMFKAIKAASKEQ